MSRRSARSRQPAASAAVVSEGGDESAPAGVGGAGQAESQPADALLGAPAEGPERIDWLRERVLTASSDLVARLELARLHAARGEYQLALDQYEAARSGHPDSLPAWLGQAEMLVALNRFDAAERELRRILKVQPENGHAHHLLGIANFRRGVYVQAEQDLRRALELLPDLPAPYFYRGEALNQLDRVDEALAMLERSLQLDPANARAFYVMGILYDKKGQPQEAALMYRRAREVAAS